MQNTEPPTLTVPSGRTQKQLKSPFLERSPLTMLRPLWLIASDTVYNSVTLSHSTKGVLFCLRGRVLTLGLILQPRLQTPALD